MKSTRILAILAALVMSAGLLAGPAQAADGSRKKANSRISVSVTKLPNGCNNIIGRVKRAGQGYAGARVIIQSKHDGRWGKVRKSAGRTDASGYVQYLNSRVKPGNPPLRIHFAGNGKTKESNSRTFHARGPYVCTAQ